MSRRQPLAVAYLCYYLETTSLNSYRNGRESRPSLLSGTDSPSDLTMMYKTCVLCIILYRGFILLIF